MTSEHPHTSHPDLIKRLKRADGHLRNVIEMMASGRACADIAQQLHAVEKAIAATKKLLIHDHLDHCLTKAAKAATTPLGFGNAIADFKDITKYL